MFIYSQFVNYRTRFSGPNCIVDQFDGVDEIQSRGSDNRVYFFSAPINKEGMCNYSETSNTYSTPKDDKPPNRGQIKSILYVLYASILQRRRTSSQRQNAGSQVCPLNRRPLSEVRMYCGDFIAGKYRNRRFVTYNFNCDDDRLAVINLTYIDLRPKNCMNPNFNNALE